MDVEQLFANFQYQDLQWFVPVMAGLIIIVGGLLIGMIRGMNAGVIVAIFFGGLMSLSPVLLNTLEQRQAGPATPASTDVARGAAELAVLNSRVVADLSRVVASMRNTLDGLTPMVTAEPGTTPSPVVVDRFTSGLSDLEARIDAAVSSVSRANLLSERLQDDLDELETELRSAAR
jgi:hypothetical protein